MKTLTRLSRLFVPALLAALVAGCFLTPRTSALKSVHDIYRQEFMRQTVRDTSRTKPGTNDFTQTLQAIRDYRVRYRNDTDSAEQAHLTVLEGMIYLQTERAGLASLVEPDVQAASGKLRSATGRDVRDRLFAENYHFLLQGLHAIRKDPEAKPFEKTFLDAANGIRSNLTSGRYKFATPDEDQGGIYLATCAAIFYVSAEVEAENAVNPNLIYHKTNCYPAAIQTLTNFLSATELKLAQSTNKIATGTEAPPGRLQYVRWYLWLNEQLQ